MDSTTAALFQELGLWIGFLFSLILFSAVIGDHFLVRLAQHILVGAGLGYAAILAIQHVLRPRLWEPLAASSFTDPAAWALIALSVLLTAAALDRLARLGRPALPPPGIFRRAVYALASLPLALLIGVGMATAIAGSVQGTFIPQFSHAAQSALDPTTPAATFIASLFTLMITTAALLFLYVDAHARLAHQPAYVRNLMAAWIWLGQRAIWLAAGMIFARLLAARLSLLIARLDYFFTALYDTGIWTWAELVWQAISRS